MSRIDPVTRAERWRHIFTVTWAVIGILLLVAVAGWVLSRITAAVVPFGLGLLIVLLLRRPVDWLARRMPRQLAVTLCYVAALAIFGVAIGFLIPPIYAQIAQFIEQIPTYAQQAYALWESFISKSSTAPDWLKQAVSALRDQVVAGAGSWSTAITGYAVSAGSSIAASVVGFVLSLVVGFYALTDLPHIEREIYVIAGERSGEIGHAVSTVTRVLGGWLRGTLIQSSVVAVLEVIGLSVAGVPYALALGVIGGLLNVIPYVGPLFSLVLAAGAGLFVSPVTAVWAAVIMFAVQQIDGLVTAPRIMSEQVDLHPMLVIFAILAGASLFGLPGVVLAVPTAAVIKALIVYWVELKGEGQIFSRQGVLLRSSHAEVAEPVREKADDKSE